jgi:hypothetical protein
MTLRLLPTLLIALMAVTPALALDRQKVSPTIVPNFNQPDLSAANNAYTMSPEELALDCKKLTGRMQVRIRQLRVTSVETKTTQLSRTLQQVATPFVAGTTRGINPDGDNARDLSMLKAYNGQLASKNCPTFDLDAQLRPGNTEDPRPIPKPKATAAPVVIGAKPPKPTAPAPAPVKTP